MAECPRTRTANNVVEENPQVEETQKKVDEFAQQQESKEIPATQQPAAQQEATPVINDPIFPESSNVETPAASPVITFADNTKEIFGSDSFIAPSLNYDNDDVFKQLVEQPTFSRSSDAFATQQSRQQVAVEEPSSPTYYELKDDTFDVFHGFAD